jgi:hypothetical protein
MRKKLLPCAAVLILLCAACENAATPAPSGSAASFTEVEAALMALPQNTADDPYPLNLGGFDFSDGNVWKMLSVLLNRAGRYVALDLSAAVCTGNNFVMGARGGGEGYIVSVSFPEGLETLAGGFGGYAHLRSVRFPGSLVNQQGSFTACPELETVSFPASVHTVSYTAFTGSPRVSFEVRGAGMLSSPAYPGIPAGKLLVRNGVTLLLAAPSLGGAITLPASITSLGEGCFSGNAALTGVIVPEGGTSIGPRTFFRCANLAAVTLPASVTAIGQFAFMETPLLASVTIPASAAVADRAFLQSGITALTVPSGARLGVEVFMNCVKLREADIQTVQFGYGLFTYCSELEQITLPASLREIPRNTFAGCVNLSTVNAVTPGTAALPASLVELRDSAFSECRSIVTVDMSGLTELVTLNASAFYHCRALANVTLPPGLSQISNAAFDGCVSLAALDIPAGITRLGLTAFKGCSALRDVTIRAVQPPSITMTQLNPGINNTFYENHADLTFHVPSGAVNAYRTAWAALGAIFTAIE